MKVIVKETGEVIRVYSLVGKDGFKRYYADNGRRKFFEEEIEIIGNKEEFKKELKALLEKHNATIDWVCHECSDLMGIYDSHLEIDINGHDTITFSTDCIDSEDL